MTKRKAGHSTGARWQVKRLKADLDSLYLRADPRNFDDPEVAADMARYLCIRVSGFLEQATSIILREYCEKNSWGNVQQFALSWLERMPNLSSDALAKLVRRFNSSFASQLVEFLENEERGARLNALVGIRNDIAHGKQQGASRQQVWAYYELTEEIIEWLLVKFEPVEIPTMKLEGS